MRLAPRALSLALILGASAAHAQQAAPNSVTNTMKRLGQGSSRNMVASAESMPADKWGFKFKPDVMTFGEIMAHVADDNNVSCTGIAGTKGPATPKPTDTRDQIIAGLKASFAFCDSALGKIDDAQLGRSVTYYGSPAPLGSVLIGLANDWGSHYSQAAVYLRLNGILPPTARKQ